MSRKCFKDEAAYKKAKAKEKCRYYTLVPTQPPRHWEDWEEELVKSSGLATRRLATELNRTVKAVEHKRSEIRKREKLQV